MVTVSITFTEEQVESLMRLAGDLRFYLNKRNRVARHNGPQKNPHKIDVSMDPWFDVLATIEGDMIATSEILHRVIGYDDLHVRPHDAKRIAACMRALGCWYGPVVLWIDGKPVRGYRRLQSITKT